MSAAESRRLVGRQIFSCFTRYGKGQGFSLVELLVVVGLIIVMLAFVGPAVTTITRGNNVTRAGNMVADQLVLARQMALARNRPVELRIIRMNSEANADRVQIVETLPSGEQRAINKIVELPTATVINNSTTFTNLGGQAANNSPDLAIPDAGEGGTDYSYLRIPFRTNGRTDFPNMNSQYFVTINAETDSASPPVNYYTLQIDPFSGTVRTYRP